MQAAISGISRTAHPLDRIMRKTAVAALAGAGLMLAASHTHAVVVASGPVNLSIPATTNGLYLNVVTGATNLPAGGLGSTVPGWDVNIWNATGLGFFNPAAPAGGVYIAVTAGNTANLASGTEIGAGGTFSNGVSTNISQWNLNSSNNLFGFRFLNEGNGQVHYGWGRIALGASITAPRTLVEYAFESVPGASIMAGSVGAIPEPSSYALMGLGALGVLLASRRRAS
jgi:PEP-CTERM motif